MAIGRRVLLEDNWSTLVEDFSASSQEFYREVERALAMRQIPQLTPSRIHWSEAGVLSGQREYLHLRRGMYHFDICAAPFGTGFFFSWWFTVRLPSWIPATIFILLAAAASWFFLGLIKTSFLIPVGWFLIGLLLIRTRTGLGNYFLAVPGLGWLWQKIFHPFTYYERDTQAMYRAAVDSAVQDVIGRTHDIKVMRDPQVAATVKPMGIAAYDQPLGAAASDPLPQAPPAAASPFKRPDLSGVLGRGPRS